MLHSGNALFLYTVNMYDKADDLDYPMRMDELVEIIRDDLNEVFRSPECMPDMFNAFAVKCFYHISKLEVEGTLIPQKYNLYKIDRKKIREIISRVNAVCDEYVGTNLEVREGMHAKYD